MDANGRSVFGAPPILPRTAGLWHAQGVVAVRAPKLITALFVAVIVAVLAYGYITYWPE